MRHTLRRVLWVVLTMFAVSVVAFWALAGGPASGSPGAASRAAGRLEPLPLFFNRNPQGVRARAQAAVDSIAGQEQRAAESARLLVRLGGAALPHVLPQLDSLSPTERSRVALHLAPLGRRMRIGSAAELLDEQAAVLFWLRYWEDHAIDYHPAAVRRSVQRAAMRMTAGRERDILQLDTFALPELIEAMGTVNGPADVPRVRRLTRLAAHVTAVDWHAGDPVTVQDARAAVARWQHWWRRNRADYVVFDGPGRVNAMLVETAYGKWASEVAHGDFGVTASGRPVLDELRRRAPVTLWLVGAAIFAGYGVGVAGGLARAARWRKPLDRIASAAAVALVAVPVATIAPLLAPQGAAPGRLLLAAVVMACVVGALVSVYQGAATQQALWTEHSRTLQAGGASPWTIVKSNLKCSGQVCASLLGVHLPTLLTAAFVIEHAFGLEGLAATTLAAVEQRNVPWLMAIALGTMLLASILQATSDALLAALDPRVRAGLAEAREGDE
jgi:ABC-type dipeptide/oligopeptide/nickel transport system permease component